MSRTFKDTPTRVRITRDLNTVEIHIGCPKADQPRYRRVWIERTSEPRWFTVQKGTDPWGGLSGDTVWRYEPVDESGWFWEPYWVSTCDIESAGQGSHKRCHHEVRDFKAVYGHRPHRHGLHPASGDQGEARRILRHAIDEHRAIGVTDPGVYPDLGYLRYWT